MGLQPSEIWDLTYKDLLIAYDASIVNSWDHTSYICSLIYNLQVVTAATASKRRGRFKNSSEFHPYRKKESKGLKVTSENISVLRMIGDALVGGK